MRAATNGGAGPRRARVVSCIVMMFALVAGACGGSDDADGARLDEPAIVDRDGATDGDAASGEADTGSTAATPTPAPAAPTDAFPADAGTFADILTLLPPNPSIQGLELVDLDAAAAQQNLARPDANDPDAVDAWLDALRAEPTDDPAGSRLGALLNDADLEDAPGWRTTWGFDITQVHRSVTLSIDDDLVWLAQVGVDPEAIDTAVRSDPFWSEHLTDAEHQGLPYYRWDETTGSDREAEGANPGRFVGDTGQLAIIGNVVVRTTDNAVMQQILATAAEPTTSLGAIIVIAVAIAELEAQGVTTAVVRFEAVPIVDSADRRTPAEVAEQQPVLLPYLAVAAGHNAEVDVIVLLHTEPEDASANAARLAQIVEIVEPWSNTVTLRSAEADGLLATAVLDGDGPFAIDALATLQSLYWSTS